MENETVASDLETLAKLSNSLTHKINRLVEKDTELNTAVDELSKKNARRDIQIVGIEVANDALDLRDAILQKCSDWGIKPGSEEIPPSVPAQRGDTPRVARTGGSGAPTVATRETNYERGTTIDLMNGKLIEFDGNGLKKQSLGPAPADCEYDFAVTFTPGPQQPDTKPWAVIYLSRQGTQFAFAIGNTMKGIGWCGFAAVQGSGADQGRKNPTYHSGITLTPNTKYRVEINVRRNLLRATVNGVETTNYGTDYNDIDTWPWCKDVGLGNLGVGAKNGPFTFHSAELTPITDSTPLLPPPPQPQQPKKQRKPRRR
jgi:hypothetical protein